MDRSVQCYLNAHFRHIWARLLPGLAHTCQLWFGLTYGLTHNNQALPTVFFCKQSFSYKMLVRDYYRIFLNLWILTQILPNLEVQCSSHPKLQVTSSPSSFDFFSEFLIFGMKIAQICHYVPNVPERGVGERQVYYIIESVFCEPLLCACAKPKIFIVIIMVQLVLDIHS